VARHVPEPTAQVEFVFALGNWTMASILLRNLAVLVEEGVMVWPPDGKRP
jgi:hypothetical protein